MLIFYLLPLFLVYSNYLWLIYTPWYSTCLEISVPWIQLFYHGFWTCGMSLCKVEWNWLGWLFWRDWALFWPFVSRWWDWIRFDWLNLLQIIFWVVFFYLNRLLNFIQFRLIRYSKFRLNRFSKDLIHQWPIPFSLQVQYDPLLKIF